MIHLSYAGSDGRTFSKGAKWTTSPYVKRELSLPAASHHHRSTLVRLRCAYASDLPQW